MPRRFATCWQSWAASCFRATCSQGRSGGSHSRAGSIACRNRSVSGDLLARVGPMNQAGSGRPPGGRFRHMLREARLDAGGPLARGAGRPWGPAADAGWSKREIEPVAGSPCIGTRQVMSGPSCTRAPQKRSSITPSRMPTRPARVAPTRAGARYFTHRNPVLGPRKPGSPGVPTPRRAGSLARGHRLSRQVPAMAVVLEELRGEAGGHPLTKRCHRPTTPSTSPPAAARGSG
jgi:hypothetical protein